MLCLTIIPRGYAAEMIHRTHADGVAHIHTNRAWLDVPLACAKLDQAVEHHILGDVFDDTLLVEANERSETVREAARE